MSGANMPTHADKVGVRDVVHTLPMRAAVFVAGVSLAACGSTAIPQPSEASRRALAAGETKWVVANGLRLKAKVYKSRAQRDHPTLVLVLHGDAPNARPSIQDVFAQRASERLDNAIVVGVLRPGRPVTRTQLRAELARRLPFETEIVICEGREIVRLMSHNPFAHQPVRPGSVRFVSVLSTRPRSAPAMPMSFPSHGEWLLTILARDNRFVFGVYRRHMKVIGYLGTFDRLFGVPVTTRNWNTITAIAKVLGGHPHAPGT